MSTALDASDYIYQGCWINWSKGRLLGSTITLTSTNSTLLTNILAVFVTIAGGQFWMILRFALYQLRASQNTNRQSNTLYHKEQVVLRNTTSSLNAAQLFLKLRWESRRNVRSASHNIPLVVIAVLSAAFFFVAAAFSNTLTNVGPHVLSRSPFADSGIRPTLIAPKLDSTPRRVVSITWHWLIRPLQKDIRTQN